MKNIVITGGAGYVGSVLVPKLLDLGHKITVLDLFIYGDHVLKTHPNLTLVKGDIRNIQSLKESFSGADTLIHLACISNDPSFDLNPILGRTINLDAFLPMLEVCKEQNFEKVIYASSSSVYGVKEEKNVHEDMSLEPLTDYSIFKADCEKILLDFDAGFCKTIVRPATVCGFSPRQRLDLVINILTNLAFHNRKITVFGGAQLRPNIHINDMADCYINLLDAPSNVVHNQIFNAGDKNFSVEELALMVRDVIGSDVELDYSHTDDNRSYHISSDKIKSTTGFFPQKSLENAVQDLKLAFESNELKDPLINSNYFNVKKMNEINLK